MVVARLEDEVTLKRYVRKDERRIELHPESTNPDHRPIRIDLEHDPFEAEGILSSDRYATEQAAFRHEPSRTKGGP